jgi:VWFA-related protein
MPEVGDDLATASSVRSFLPSATLLLYDEAPLMRELCCLIAMFAAALQGVAQNSPQSPSAAGNRSADQPPVFRVTTRLVQVSVVVHDRRGEPVMDLKKEDFTITERGKPQQISVFAMESADRRSAPSAALPPHIFSNVFAEKAGVPTSITIILLDLLNTTWIDQHYARKALIKFLGQIQPQDRIAIYALGRRSLTLLHDYTTDSASLIARLKKVSGEIPSELDASTLDPNTQQELQNLDLGALADANQQQADFFTAGRVENTLSTLEAIAQHLSGLPGRKNLIWLSGGFPLTIGFDEFPAIGSTRDRRTFTAEMDAAVRALNNSGIAVYPVDARGLMVAPGFSASTRGSPSIAAPPRSRLGPIVANLDSMDELAERTGGRAAYNTNDLARAIRRAIDDARVTYTIGYYPTDVTQDGKFRDIKVKVNRSRVDVRYRKGYFAFKPSDTSDKTRKAEMRGAVWSPLESTAVAMNARADFIDSPEANTINVFVQIDPATVGFRKEGDRWKAELDVVYVQKDEHGRMPGDGLTDNLSLALSDANYATVVQQGLIRQRRLPRHPGAIHLRIVVRDVSSGSLGSLTIPFSQIATHPQKLAPELTP